MCEEDGRVAVITGAGSGIGRETAHRLAAAGYAIAAVDIDGSAVTATATSIAASGGMARSIPADVAIDSDCDAAVDAATELGRIHALVNVAGVMVQNDTVEHIRDEELERIMAVNVMSIFRMGRHAIPLMRPSGGVIVNVASVHAYASMSACSAYAASKGAVVSLTRQMAIDLAGSGIRVTAVAPGAVDTPLATRVIEWRQALGSTNEFSTTPLEVGRVLLPAEIASVVEWLVSDASSAMNGHTVIADAGLLAGLT